MNRREMISRAMLGALAVAANPFRAFGAKKKEYSVANGDRGRVYDRDGNEIEYVIACNVETGCILQFVTGTNGKPRLDATGCYLLRQTKTYPAPLRFERTSCRELNEDRQ